MNVNDINQDVIPTPTAEKDMFDLIFERQHSLAIKYTPIEGQNGLLQTELFPGDLDDKKSQARMKDFAWRTQEELYEATESLSHKEHDTVHFLEEVIDAIHFFTELNLFCGYTAEEVAKYYGWEKGDKFEYLESLANKLNEMTEGPAGKGDKNYSIPALIYVSIGQPIGDAMNKLKNKPWKQTHMVTDKEAFKGCLLCAWLGFFRVLHNVFDLSAKDIFTLYFKKSEVNKFRIKSKY